MLSSVTARAVKREILKPTAINPLPPSAYFNAASHTYRFKHTQIGTHHDHSVCANTHIHLQCSTCRCITHTLTHIQHTHMQLRATFHYAGVQFKQRILKWNKVVQPVVRPCEVGRVGYRLVFFRYRC